MTESVYKGRLRVRACAIIVERGNILLVKHYSPTRPGPIWLPPGGGVQFGETTREAVVREVKEETGLRIKPVRVVWIHEFLEKPYHAIEFYYECTVTGGALMQGRDPEHEDSGQMIAGVDFISCDEAAMLNVCPGFLKECCRNGCRLPAHITHVSGDGPSLSVNE